MNPEDLKFSISREYVEFDIEMNSEYINKFCLSPSSKRKCNPMRSRLRINIEASKTPRYSESENANEDISAQDIAQNMEIIPMLLGTLNSELSMSRSRKIEYYRQDNALWLK